MLLSELLTSAGVSPKRLSGDIEINAVHCDSRRCGKGSCFVAVRGVDEDGHRFIPAALAAGASAVICQDDAGVPFNVPHAVFDDARLSLGPLAQACLGWPARKLTNIGVAGTKGKTTITYLIRSILKSAGVSSGLIGTITCETGRRIIESKNTSPDAALLAELQAEMVAAGMTHMVMEVSSHALHQHRVGGVDFRVGVFTNLTGDHMDYHKTEENYFAAKRMLFESLSPGAAAVINIDDPHGPRIVPATRAKVCRYGIAERPTPAMEFRADIRRMDFTGSEFVLHAGGRAIDIRTPLMGRHNVYNCLAAAGACWSLGIELDAIAASLSQVTRVPGRLERVPIEAPYQVFVDYAHTDDSLANVLRAMGHVKGNGRVLVVFGCGGNRDTTKRPRMARVAEELADGIFVTSDNPRKEDAQSILDMIVAGFSPQGLRRAVVEIDRRKAITLAVNEAKAGDIVLIAGKGHENYQIIGETKHHFDDIEVASQAIRSREGRA